VRWSSLLGAVTLEDVKKSKAEKMTGLKIRFDGMPGPIVSF
jgi:hypothetical protein